MITYKDFIKMMERKGYIQKNLKPITIIESDKIIKTYKVRKGGKGKILELSCPENDIIMACGKTHDNEYSKSYECHINCFDNENNEAFQGLHYSTPIKDDFHVLAELVVTKILIKEPDKYNDIMQDWLKETNPILRTIGINNPREYMMWYGAYKLFSENFLDASFNLYGNEKMIFYITNPDVNIDKIIFNIKVDILEYPKLNEDLVILDKNKITDISNSNYKSVLRAN